jgi:two-component system response regulator FixJ
MSDGRNPMIAVVDDDLDVRESLRFLLETAGYSVATYESANDYLDRVAADHPACLVLDQHMPQVTGVELLALLRERGAALPTALITGSPTPELLRRAAALGAQRVLEKPLADDALLRFIRCATSGAAACS